MKINQLSVLLPGHIGDLLNCRIPHEVSSGDTTAHTSLHNLPDTDNSFNNNSLLDVEKISNAITFIKMLQSNLEKGKKEIIKFVSVTEER